MVASMNEMAYVVQAWLPLVVWKQVEQPRYHKGFITATCLSFMMIVTALMTRELHMRELGQRRKAQEEVYVPQSSAGGEEAGSDVDADLMFRKGT